MNGDLFPPPQHYFVADTLALLAHDEIRRMAHAARAAIAERFRQIEITHRRSIAQRRRFWRLRILQEKQA